MVAWIAFAISLVSAAGAIFSAWYARSQARHAKEAVGLERRRLHRDLTPTITGVYLEASAPRSVMIGGREYVEAGNGEERTRVRLTNRGGIDLERIDVSLIPPHRHHEKVIEGFYDHRTRDAVSSAETGRLSREASWELEVVHHATSDGPIGGTVKFRCLCHASGHDPWDVVVEVEFPELPMVAFGSR
ncbi:hypothetical protein [Allorhizocola rhizosphaerae]|uniref:hypothetical protein n=1 Tax=Allorhizocola rhizosphaerae TaxID=1872709 RepID=UPI000E3BB234|nr:hypothetical protein [Allorhizocola rhizosphaerae]